VLKKQETYARNSEKYLLAYSLSKENQSFTHKEPHNHLRRRERIILDARYLQFLSLLYNTNLDNSSFG